MGFFALVIHCKLAVILRINVTTVQTVVGAEQILCYRAQRVIDFPVSLGLSRVAMTRLLCTLVTNCINT